MNVFVLAGGFVLIAVGLILQRRYYRNKIRDITSRFASYLQKLDSK